jgi:hypothetical protein
MSTEFKFNSHAGLVLIDVQKAFTGTGGGAIIRVRKLRSLCC